MNEKTSNPPSNNSFLDVLTRLRSGAAVEELSDELANLIARVRATGKPGTLSFSMTITPLSRGSGNAVDVRDKIASRMPEFDAETTIFYADDQHRLHRSDPRQKEMEFQPKAIAGAMPEQASDTKVA